MSIREQVDIRTPFIAASAIAVMLSLLPVYRRWPHYDVFTHAMVSLLCAVWLFRYRYLIRYPAFVFAVLALGWEWIELTYPSIFYSPSRYDLLSDLSINFVSFGIALVVLHIHAWSPTRAYTYWK